MVGRRGRRVVGIGVVIVREVVLVVARRGEYFFTDEADGARWSLDGSWVVGCSHSGGEQTRDNSARPAENAGSRGGAEKEKNAERNRRRASVPDRNDSRAPQLG